ncbi:MAG TPA: site-2 protease family protein [Terriglobales bacterium]|jgi:Zn-dependent protease/predicted transcriptional regulator|nr:site-2 protease family protein [Terriglobales bacterium]
MSMRSWSIPLGRLFGIEIRIHLTFLFLLFFVWGTEATTQNANATLHVLALVGIVFGSVVLHELGHALVARGSGVPAKGIILLPIGGITILDEAHAIPDSVNAWKRDIRIAAAGPVVNLIIAGLSALILVTAIPGFSLTTRPLLHSTALLRSIVWVNLYLGLFNLLPAYPMDGGRVLRAIFSRRVDMVRATQRAVRIGHVFSFLFMMVGFLLGNWWLAMIGLFLFLGAQLEERSAVFQSVLQSVRLEEVMLTDFATLSPADTLEDALEKAVHTLQDDFPVVRGSDMVGVVSRQKILEALRAEGNGYVQAVMNRIFEVAAKQESLASAFRKLSARNLSIIPVVDEQQLVGIVTLQNLMHSMSLLAESRKLRRAALDS